MANRRIKFYIDRLVSRNAVPFCWADCGIFSVFSARRILVMTDKILLAGSEVADQVSVSIKQSAVFEGRGLSGKSQY